MSASDGAGDPVQANTLRFITALSFLTDQAHVGRPFGEGTGLEVARSVARTTFNSLDEVREGGSRLAISMITNDALHPDDVSGVMGAGALDTSGLTPEQAQAARDLGGAAITFLGQINRDGENIWELWKRNDEVAEEVLCWLAVAWGRLETTGAVERL